MKKLFALIIVAVLSFSIVACKKADSEVVTDDESVELADTDSTNAQVEVEEAE